MTQAAGPGLSVADAVARARQANPALLAARADARAAAGDALGGTRAFLPAIGLEFQGVRTTDPVAAFGMKLRQEVFSGNDLTLDALNRPAAFGGYSTALRVEWPLFALEGLFQHRAARAASAAAEAGARRMAGATTFFVTQAYWDVQLAEARVAALAAARAATEAHASQAEALRDQGLVTGLDARLARVAAAGLAARHAGALALAANARATLAALLGLPPDTTVVLSDSLTATMPAACDDGCAAMRGDLDALTEAVAAATAAARSARAAHLPQIAVFGAFAHHGGAAPWGTGSGDWTVGLAVRWNLLPALSGIGSARAGAARREAALARLAGAERQAEVERTSARRLADAAAQAVTVTAAAHDEVLQALAQADVRYRTGVSTISELLDVQAAATQAALDLAQARRDLRVALAARDLASGVHDR